MQVEINVNRYVIMQDVMVSDKARQEVDTL